MKNAVIGQLAELMYGNEGSNVSWQYCVVEHIFDDRIQFKKADGRLYMHVFSSDESENDILNKQPTKSKITLLYKDNKPVMAKKKLFGGYKIKP